VSKGLKERTVSEPGLWCLPARIYGEGGVGAIVDVNRTSEVLPAFKDSVDQ